MDWPAVPLPPDSSGERVTGHMKNNGRDMRASRFLTPHSIDEVVGFYQRKWPRAVVDAFGGKTIVGRAQDGYYITVTLADVGGATRGTVGTMKMPTGEIDYAMGGGFDKPPNTTVVNDFRYFDTPGEPRTLAMVNGLSPYQNYRYYLQQLPADGWQFNRKEGQRCTWASATCAAVFGNSAGESIVITLSREMGSRTRIVVNIQ